MKKPRVGWTPRTANKPESVQSFVRRLLRTPLRKLSDVRKKDSRTVNRLTVLQIDQKLMLA